MKCIANDLVKSDNDGGGGDVRRMIAETNDRTNRGWPLDGLQFRQV